MQNQKGFTLVELVIAGVFSSIVLFGLVAGNVMIQRSEQETFERSSAVNDAHRAIEMMRREASTAWPGFPANVTGDFPANAAIAGFNALQAEQVVPTYVNTTSDPLDVTVTVTWTGRNNRQMTERLRTLITRRVK